MRKPCCLLPAVLIVFLSASLASAVGPVTATFVAPTSLRSNEGNRSYGFSGAATFQQVFGTSQLVGLSSGDKITGMQLRINGTDDFDQANPAGPASTVTVSALDVFLGPSNFPVGSLSSSVAGNQGPGTVLARSGSLTIPPLSFPGPGTPPPFGLLIPFTTPYTYTGGDLLFTWSHTTPSGGNLNFDTGFTTVSNVQARQALSYNSATVGSNFPNTALVVQFTTIPAPEPGGLLLCSLALTAIAARRRRRRRMALNG
jgi:hypothetical protein